MSMSPYNWLYDIFSDMDGAFGGVLGVLGIIFFVILGVMLLVGIGLYILQSLGLYSIAKRRGLDNPWMAWVPVVNMYLLGIIADELVTLNGRKNWNMRWLILYGLCAVIVLELLSFIPFIGFLFSMLAGLCSMGVAVIEYFAVYELFKEYEEKNAVLYLVLSIIISPILSIFIFLLRNKPAVHGDVIQQPDNQ